MIGGPETQENIVAPVRFEGRPNWRSHWSLSSTST